MRAEGVGGELRHGYALAGRLDRWVLTAADKNVVGSDRHVVRGELRLDPFYSKREPLRLTLRVGNLTWTWDHARIEDGGLIVIEGAPTEGVRVIDVSKPVR